jgi:predicted NUDIX family NTP pyrophosphohydrolase
MYRRTTRQIEVFLVHPGGPFWANKDQGAWTIPKGEFAEGEDPLDAARREFHEETGFTVQGNLFELGTIRQPGGKIVYAWAFEGDCDPAAMISNLCTIEWPPRSGRRIEIPEVDRGAWFTLPEAHERIHKNQTELLNRLLERTPE